MLVGPTCQFHIVLIQRVYNIFSHVIDINIILLLTIKNEIMLPVIVNNNLSPEICW